MVQYLQNLRLKRFNVKLWMAIKQREIQLQTLFRMLSIIYKVLNWVQVEILYRALFSTRSEWSNFQTCFSQNKAVHI